MSVKGPNIQRKLSKSPDFKRNIPSSDIVNENKQKSKNESKLPSLGVVTKRQGGGTLIESRPIFSQCGKHIYVNCGWGLKAFSVKTGECIKVYDALKFGAVIDIFTYRDRPSAVTSKSYFISWEGKSGQIKHQCRLDVPKFNIKNAYLVPFVGQLNSILCISFVRPHDETFLLFFNPLTGKQITHRMSETVLSCGKMKHNLSFGGKDGHSIVASISPSNLSIFSLDENYLSTDIRPFGDREWTCVRCHPTEEIVAAGDNTGRVVVFTNPFNNVKKNIPTAIYHWHTLPCQDIAFSPAGSTMYSGGGEHVLVKWNLDNPTVRYFLPRLSGDIVHINVSSNNQLVAVATLDNAIQVVEPPIRLKCVLQQLAWGILPTPYSNLFPAGLVYEPRSRALALNGRPGHLQFYSPVSEAILSSIDVSLQNYMTQERTKILINTEITHAAITNDGAWLATIETRDDPQVTLELRLKLWQYINAKKSFTLNSSIELPHDGKVGSLVFKPYSTKLSTNDELNLDYLLATTGKDKKFRLWAPHDLDSIYRKGVSWQCENTCYYRDIDCDPASFSEDGSLIAVGFGPNVTVWDVDSVRIKETLTIGNDVIKLIAFGMKECFHLLVCTTKKLLFVWNLLTLRLSWKVPVQTAILTADPYSTYMAAFTADNKLYVFSPSSTKSVYESEKVCKKGGYPVLAATFVPRERAFLEGPHWLQYSQLYYIDSKQELNCFESEEESGEVSMLKLAHDNDPGTLFSTLLAAQRVSHDKDEKKTDSKPQHFGVLGAAAVTQLLQAPVHTMPPVSLLCSSLLQSLILSKKTYEKDEKTDKKDGNSDEDEENDEEKTSSESDSDDELKKKENNDSKLSAMNICLSSSNESLNADKSDSVANNSRSAATSDAPYFISELLDSIDNSDRLFEIDE